MTETTPDTPPLDPNDPDPDPNPIEPTPDEPPAAEDPGEEQPPVPSTDPCTAVWSGDPAVVCELFANHAEFRLNHTRHVNGTVYEWE